MFIFYSVPMFYTKEVSSKKHDECLLALERLMEIGYVKKIDKHYSEHGWHLIGHVGCIDCISDYTFSGKWEEEIGEAREIKACDITIDYGGEVVDGGYFEDLL